MRAVESAPVSFLSQFVSPEDEASLPAIFVVTLAEEPWKAVKAREHFHKLGLSPLLVEGSQGITLGLRATNPYDYDQHGSALFMHISQIGCVISHRLALSVAIASGAPEFIICEDDVRLPENFKLTFRQFRAALPEDAEVVQLDYRGGGDKDTLPVNDRVQHIYYPFCSSCIWWKRSAAQQALILLKPVDRPYDVMLIQRVFPFLNHYVPTAPIASELSSLKEWPSSVGDAPKVES